MGLPTLAVTPPMATVVHFTPVTEVEDTVTEVEDTVTEVEDMVTEVVTEEAMEVGIEEITEQATEVAMEVDTEPVMEVMGQDMEEVMEQATEVAMEVGTEQVTEEATDMEEATAASTLLCQLTTKRKSHSVIGSNLGVFLMEEGVTATDPISLLFLTIIITTHPAFGI